MWKLGSIFSSNYLDFPGFGVWCLETNSVQADMNQGQGKFPLTQETVSHTRLKFLSVIQLPIMIMPQTDNYTTNMLKLSK